VSLVSVATQAVPLEKPDFAILILDSAAVRRYLRNRSSFIQFPTAIYKVCVPAVPLSVNVTGTVSLAATFGTTTLNW
jgi:hypothetical protein